MSAFLVSQTHLNAIAAYAHTQGMHHPERAFQTMLNENMRSLRTRYDDVTDWADDAKEYRFIKINLPILVSEWTGRPIVQIDARAVATFILKACDCYIYQACESDDYDESAAAALTKLITELCIANGAEETGSLYDSLPWGID